MNCDMEDEIKNALAEKKNFYHISFWNFLLNMNLPLYPFCAELSIRYEPHKMNMVQHPFFLIIYLASGALLYHIQDKKIKVQAGDLILIPPLTSYYFESYSTGGHYQKYVIEIKGGLLNDYIMQLNLNQLVHLKNIDSEEFLNTYREIERINQECREEDIPEGIACCIRLLHRFALLNQQNIHIGSRDELFEKCCKLIENNLDQPVNLGFLVEKMSISRSTLGRLFRKYLQMSPQQYWRMRKLETAEYLLINTDFSIKEIAFRLGYSSQFHFSNEFSARKSCSPQQFRRRGFI